MKKILLIFIAILCEMTCFAQLPTENLFLWLSADSVEIASGTTNRVSRMYDKSGNNNSFTQSNSTYRPTLVNSSFLNKNVVSFNGSNQYIVGSFPTPLDMPYLIFIMWNSSRSNTSTQMIFSLNNVNYFFDSGTTNNQVRLCGSLVYNKTYPITNYILTTGIVNGSSSYLYENLTYKATGSINNINNTTSCNIGRLFVESGTSSRYFEGNMFKL